MRERERRQNSLMKIDHFVAELIGKRLFSFVFRVNMIYFLPLATHTNAMRAIYATIQNFSASFFFSQLRKTDFLAAEFFFFPSSMHHELKIKTERSNRFSPQNVSSCGARSDDRDFSCVETQDCAFPSGVCLILQRL